MALKDNILHRMEERHWYTVRQIAAEMNIEKDYIYSCMASLYWGGLVDRDGLGFPTAPYTYRTKQRNLDLEP